MLWHRFGQRSAVALKSIVLACLWLVSAAGSAKDLMPDAQMKAFTDDVIGIIKQEKEGDAASRKKANEQIEAKMLPLFDFSRMTARAVGANWAKASAEQQRALTREFHVLLVRSFVSALSSYKNETIEFKPMRAAPGGTQVTVKLQIRRPGTEPISIDYGMEKAPAGWMVYDLVVAGVNLVTNYRETFNAEIRDRGFDGLITSLANKNRSLDPQAGPAQK